LTRVRSYELGFSPTRPAEVAPDAVATALRVPPESAGMRLDRFVQSQLRRTSRTRTQVIIRVSAFSPDGKRLRPSDRVRAEQHVMLWRAPWDEEGVDEELRVLYEDPHYLAVDKPPMIPVHPTARYFRSTVVKLLEVARPEDRLFLAHRLDRETSGVLLLSRTNEADRAVKRAFAGLDPRTGKPVASRLIGKVYLAIARGSTDRARFRVEHPLEEDPESRFRVKMRVARPGEGLTAATEFEVVERRRRDADGSTYTLLRCHLETGRQHQIRVHLASEGLPIVGDKLYGGDDELFARGADGELTDEDLAALELPRQALHAHVLELEHPVLAGETIRVESPLPPDMATFWARLEPDGDATARRLDRG
jgi:23S rRNA pseudouridine1911/1915/1917 synthase